MKKTVQHTLFTRFIWLALTLFTVVFCGPVKRAIEQRLDHAGIVCTNKANKHLRTWYREKRDTAPTIHFSIHQLPDNGFGPVPASISFSLAFLHRHDVVLKNTYAPDAAIAALPLYLHFRQLRV